MHLRIDARDEDEIALGVLLVSNVVIVFRFQAGGKPPRDRPPQQVVIANGSLRLPLRLRRQVARCRNSQRFLPVDDARGGKETHPRDGGQKPKAQPCLDGTVACHSRYSVAGFKLIRCPMFLKRQIKSELKTKFAPRRFERRPSWLPCRPASSRVVCWDSEVMTQDPGSVLWPGGKRPAATDRREGMDAPSEIILFIIY